MTIQEVEVGPAEDRNHRDHEEVVAHVDDGRSSAAEVEEEGHVHKDREEDHGSLDREEDRTAWHPCPWAQLLSWILVCHHSWTKKTAGPIEEEVGRRDLHDIQEAVDHAEEEEDHDNTVLHHSCRALLGSLEGEGRRARLLDAAVLSWGCHPYEEAAVDVLAKNTIQHLKICLIRYL